MALIRCPECGKEVSELATICPDCGYPICNKVQKNCVEKKVSNAIPIVSGILSIVLGLIFIVLVLNTSLISVIPNIYMIICGVVALAGIGKKNITKVVIILYIIGIGLGFMFSLLACICMAVFGFLEIRYSRKL